MSTNNAAIFSGSLEDPSKIVEIKQVPYPKASDDQLIVKAVAYAINPTDWKQIYFGLTPKGSITGSDVSGIVESVGANVKGFAKGDYVSTFVQGNVSPDFGGFQNYVRADPSTTLKFDPKQISEDALKEGDYESSITKSFEGAASLPLGLTTVSISFASNLEIPLSKEANKGKSILIWGGATATGILAIQVAKQIYGLNVLTTASSKNHEYLKSIGADETFDYRDPKSLEQLTKFDISYALDTVSADNTFQQTYDATKGSSNVRLDNLLFIQDKDLKKDDRSGKHTVVNSTLAYVAVGRPINAYGMTLEITPEQFTRFKELWFNVLPNHLSSIKHANLKVLKSGLESANEGFELNKQGKVSAQKVVFRV
ncbi:hypothetical protein BN7_2934 [Wickerhamomyces ciferrii]|uniref:Enoyl reductase (ER) domain-containing protein n=1 Tax=Wickerhamomyces ciferrii (strain ATCC 14091 / BCRC 22168 / CBS 111 / JCM 3599 / NBRC 0793 / NRRL Y-1031 F-60-10) TaxID=1206466 RepID=K0KKB2_WICCF|nr:uncharacterized protein BN7_2934 [Wickerhamomyces ciferrii]CCH43386.1 hypothetical protein BN7_2934 [Wickerhamomyces ciferrii]